MKGMLKCNEHKNTFLASNETVLDIFRALMTDPYVWIRKLERCENGGWHIFVRNLRFKK